MKRKTNPDAGYASFRVTEVVKKKKKMDPIAKAQKEAKEKQIKATRGENPYAEGTRYYDLYENNPYSLDKFTREQTFWDRFANAWGIRSSYDAALDEWNKSALEYDAQIAQLKGEDEYNSEQAKTSRMRGAGLNPDLVGLESASEAGEFAQEQTSPDINRESDQVEKVIGLIGQIPKIITLSLSVTEEAAKSLGTIYETGIKKGDALLKRNELVNSWIDNFSYETRYDKDGKKLPFNYDATAGEMKNQAENWARMNGMGKKESTRFARNVYDAAMGGRKGELYDKWNKQHEARKKFGTTITSKFDPKEGNQEHFVEVLGDLVVDLDNILQDKTGAEALKALNEENYQRTFNGVTAAQAQNEENEAKKGKAKIQKEVRESIQKASAALDEECKKGKVGAIMAKTALESLYLKYLD